MPVAVFYCKIEFMKTTILQPDYTTPGEVYQLVIPMDIGEMIPADDSVRLLNAVFGRMDYSKLYAAYSRRTMGTGVSPCPKVC